MVSLRKLRAFVAVFEEGSFTAAAAREGATQSGISQQVKQLESMLNAVLFTRHGRVVEPTPAGGKYYPECVAILRRLEQANVVNSLTNLLTFPRLRTLIERGDIATHGAYFGVATGHLSLRDPASGEFRQVDSSPALRGGIVGAHDGR